MRGHAADGRAQGRMEGMSNHGTGGAHGVQVPLPRSIGFRTQFLTDTRGAGIASSYADGYEPWAGRIEHRPTAPWSRTAPAW
ncbi:hypothetical protein QJS66_22065 [Kocuria rhizophila]|nr:hypothetical protein QJS66_22065 [Kocuria rhizophila]